MNRITKLMQLIGELAERGVTLAENNYSVMAILGEIEDAISEAVELEVLYENDIGIGKSKVEECVEVIMLLVKNDSRDIS